MSQRSQERESNAQKRRGRTQRSRVPNKTKAVPERPAQKSKPHKRGRCGHAKEKSLSQRSQDRKSKAHKERGRTQISRDHKKKDVPENPAQKSKPHKRGRCGHAKEKSLSREARTENQKRTRSGEGTREAGTLRK